MKYLVPILVGAAGIVAAITTAIAGARGVFIGRVPLAPYLWGYGASAVLLALAVIIALRQSSRETQTANLREMAVPTHPIHIENRFENIGNPVQKQAGPQSPYSPLAPPKAQPNIKYLNARNRVPRNELFGEQIRDGKIVVVGFRNDPVIGVDVAQPMAHANVIYRNSNKDEIAEVSTGLWEDDSASDTYLKAGTTKYLIVLLVRSGKSFKVWGEHRATNFGTSYIVAECEQLDEAVAEIEIRIIASGSVGRCLWTGILVARVPEGGNEPQFSIRPDSPG